MTANKRVSVEDAIIKIRKLPPMKAEAYLRNKLERNGFKGYVVLK